MKLLWVAAVFGGLLTSPAWANGFSLYPVPTVIGLKEGVSNDTQLVNSEFRQAIDVPGMGRYFADSLKQAFPTQYVDQIDPQNRRRTFVVSLQLTRASHYTVPRIDGTVTHYLPVTVALVFTNPLTGEVLFTHSLTRYDRLMRLSSVSDRDLAADVRASYNSTLKTLVQEVLQESARDFKPFEVEAYVQDEWNGLYLMNKGLDGGVARGDKLNGPAGQLLEVLHSAAGYSVARVELANGSIKGLKFTKYTTMRTEDLKKPRVLLVNSRKPDEQQASAESLFGDFLGYRANFTLTPVNANFQQVLGTVAQLNQGLSTDEVVNNRALPGYFLRLKTLQPVSFDIPTKSASVIGKHIETRVYGELIDSSGRVVFASEGRDVYDDQSVDGMTFDEEMQRQVRLKNAVTDLAEKFVQGVQFKSLELKVSGVNKDEVRIDDPYGVLPLDRIIRLYRPIDDGVLVPIFDATVMLRDGHVAVAKLSSKVANEIAKHGVNPEVGDRVLVETVGDKNASLTPLVICPDSPPSLHPALQDVAVIGYFQLARLSQQPFFADVRGVRQQVIDLTQYAGFRSKDLNLPESIKAPSCLQPKAKLTDLKLDSCQKGFCRQSFNLAAGYVRKEPSAENKVYALGGQSSSDDVPELAQSSAAYLRLRVQYKLDEFMTDIINKMNGAE